VALPHITNGDYLKSPLLKQEVTVRIVAPPHHYAKHFYENVISQQLVEFCRTAIFLNGVSAFWQTTSMGVELENSHCFCSLRIVCRKIIAGKFGKSQNFAIFLISYKSVC